MILRGQHEAGHIVYKKSRPKMCAQVFRCSGGAILVEAILTSEYVLPHLLAINAFLF